MCYLVWILLIPVFYYTDKVYKESVHRYVFGTSTNFFFFWDKSIYSGVSSYLITMSTHVGNDEIIVSLT